jgi:hypothetical protein
MIFSIQEGAAMQIKLSGNPEKPFPSAREGDGGGLGIVHGIAELLIISLSGCQPKLEKK